MNRFPSYPGSRKTMKMSSGQPDGGNDRHHFLLRRNTGFVATGVRSKAQCVGYASLASAFALAISPSSALAQDDQPVKNLVITPSIEATYDSNIFRVDRAVTQPVDDVIISPGALVELTQPFGRHTLKLRGSGYLDTYVQGSTRNRARLNVAGDGIIRVGQTCRTTLSGAFRRQRSDFGDINGTIENLQSTSVLGAEFACPDTVGFYPIGGIRRITTSNSDSYDFADQTTVSYKGGVGFATPSLGNITAYYEHSDTDRPVLFLTNKIDRAGLTFERAVVSRFSLDADVHWLRLRSSNPVIPNYDRPGWDINIRINPIPTVLSFRARFARAIVNDSLVPAGYAIATTYAGTGQWLVTDRTAIDFSIEHSDRSYRRDPVLVVSQIDADKVNLYIATVRRKIGRALEIYARGQRVTRSTDAGVANYSANIATLGVSTEF